LAFVFPFSSILKKKRESLSRLERRSAMKKNLLVLSSLILIGTLASCAASTPATPSSSLPTTSSAPLSVERKSAVEYIGGPTAKSTIDLCFLNGVKDIPFLEMADVATELLKIGPLLSSSYTLTPAYQDGVYTLTWENGASVVFDFNQKTLTYNAFDYFFATSAAETGIDVVGLTGFNSKNEPSLIEREKTDSSYRSGPASITIALGEKGIPLYRDGAKAYLPLQTFSDFLISPNPIFYAYNGADVFIGTGSTDDNKYTDLYYTMTPSQRSEALADFTYTEFAAMFDTFYGLKDVKHIDSLDTFVTNLGLKADLTSLEAKSADVALAKLAYSYLGDQHTKYLSNSPYLGKDVTIKKEDYWSSECHDMYTRVDGLKAARSAAYPAMPFFEIVGDTAFFQFDTFAIGAGESYYTTEPSLSSTDSLGQMLYAHKQILAAGSAVKNVVMDLSCNTGGQADMAALASAWFLGESVIAVNNTCSGSEAMNAYRVDANLDHKFDANDTLGDRKLYCLTSRASFSCGNLLPNLFKNSGKVSLIGQKSGGGACVVAPLSLADGTIFRISGARRLDTVKNGTFYPIDQGADPDYAITDLSFLYQNKRADLVNYIDSLH